MMLVVVASYTQVILDVALRFPGVETPAQLQPPDAVMRGQLSSSAMDAVNAASASLRSFYHVRNG